MNNAALRAKPFYACHREVSGAPVVADTSDLVALLVANPRSTIDCGGYKSVSGSVRLTGGAAPTVTLQPLELVILPDGTSHFVIAGLSTAALSDNDAFTLTVNNAFLFLRIDAVANAPTKVEIFLAGAEMQTSWLGMNR